MKRVQAKSPRNSLKNKEISILAEFQNYQSWLCACSLLFFCISSKAQADLLITWDCNLPADRINCQNLKRDFFNTSASLREESDAARSDISLTVIRNRNAGRDSTTYVTSFDYHLDHISISPLTISEEIPDSQNNTSAYSRVLNGLNRGILPVFNVVRIENSEGQEHQISVTLADPLAHRERTTRRASVAPSSWFVSPSLSANISHSSVTFVSANGDIDLNYTAPQWRILGELWANYQRLTIPGTSTSPESEAEYFTYGGKSILVRSLGPMNCVRNSGPSQRCSHWSLAVITSFLHSPEGNENNQRGLVNGSAGIEWNLVPFRRNGENNFGVRFIVGAENQWFDQRNINSASWQTYLRSRMETYLAWHLSRADFNARFSANLPIDSIDTDRWLRFVNLAGDIDLTFRVTDSLRLGTRFNLTYRAQLMNQPGSVGSSDAAAQFLGANNYGDIVFNGSFNVVYIFGNTLLPNQDQRWR